MFPASLAKQQDDAILERLYAKDAEDAERVKRQSSRADAFFLAQESSQGYEEEPGGSQVDRNPVQETRPPSSPTIPLRSLVRGQHGAGSGGVGSSERRNAT